MKIQHKIIVSFLCVMVLFLAAGLVIGASVQQMNALEATISTDYAINAEAMKYQDGVRQLQVGESFVVQGNTAMGSQLIGEGKDGMESSRANLRSLVTDPSLLTSLDEISRLEAGVLATSEEIDRLSTSADPARQELLNRKLATLQDQVEALNLGISAFVDRTDQNLVAAIKAAKEYGSFTTTVTILSFVIALCISMAIAFFLAGRITRPIVKLTGIANKVSNGILVHTITRESDDEIGDLADSFRKMINAFKVIQSMSAVRSDEQMDEDA
ncbi:MAG: HAMP domain-containing protein [Methanomicrobiales archaeon]|nr:HAMP domain-containing protein [Methanomicrobiales archaeon]